MTAKQKKLLDTLFSIAASHLDNLKEIGKLLVELRDTGYPIEVCRARLKDEFGLSFSATQTAIRWASGDFGCDDEFIHMLLGKATPSVLTNMSGKTIDDLKAGRFRIVSPTEGKVVTKTIHEMNRAEVRKNLRPQGILTVSATYQKEPIYRNYVATGFEMVSQVERDADRGAVAFICDRNGGSVRIKVSRKLLLQAADSVSPAMQEA